MIGIGACKAVQAFSHVEPTWLLIRRIQTPAYCQAVDRAVTVLLSRQKIAVERENAARSFQTEDRPHLLAKQETGRLPVHVVIHGFVNVPLGMRQAPSYERL